MPADGHLTCPRCGASVRADDALCPACLLAAGAAAGSEAPEEALFRAVLELPPEARPVFLRQQTAGNPALLAAVELLLQGYEEAGGAAAARPPGTSSAPTVRWSANANEEPGTVIGPFRLLRLIGEGGMGTVWQAEQTAPVRRSVALKVIKLGMDTRDVVKRFERERQTLALLNHPNIAQVHEAGATVLGRPFFAMELVEGQPITAYCDRAGLDLEARLNLFRAVCAAVEHAHQKGVIHRDLKPSNLLVTHSGLVKVIDFGVAKATQTIGDTPWFTRQAQILGTPAYMSPEQARSAGVDIDTRTDVYALGVILYELLTGVLPIDSRRLAATGIAEMQRILQEEEPPTPSTRIAAAASSAKPGAGTASAQARFPLRGDLDWVVMKAIRKDRNERYPSAATLAEDLRRYLAHEPVSAVPPTLGYHVRKFVRRNRASVLAGATIIAALLLGLVVSLVQVRRARQALAGEAKARAEATVTLSDMYARSGLAAAEKADVTRAELWFANAATLGAMDPARAAANRRRAIAWRSEAMTAVRAFDTGCEHLRQFHWNPRHPALIVVSEGAPVAQVWDLATEQPWQPARGVPLNCAAWDGSGDRIAVVTANQEIQVLEYPSGKVLARLTGVAPVNLEWSPDNRWLAAGSLLWDWRTNERRALPQAAWATHFSRDGRWLLLLTGAAAGVCAAAAPERFLYPPVPVYAGDSCEFLGDGRRFVAGNPQGGLTICDSASGRTLATQANDGSDDRRGVPVGVSADGRFIARCNEPLFDLENPTPGNFPLHHGLFTAASFSPDGTLLASGGYDNRLELWTLPEGKFLGEVGHHHTGVVNLEFSPDGRFVASGEDGLVRVWRVARPGQHRHIPTRGDSLAALSPDGKWVAAAGFSNQDGAVRETQVFGLGSGQPVGPRIVPGGLLMDAKFSPDGNRLALALSTTPDRSNAAFENSGGSGNVQFWNPRTGERLGEPLPLPAEPRGLGWHPSGQWLGVCCAGGEGVEINVSNRTSQVLFTHHKSVNAGATLNNGRCAYSPDGRILAAWGLFQFTDLWDRQQARELREPFERDSTTFDLAFYDTVVARAVVASSMRLEFCDLRTGAAAAPPIPYVNWPLLTRFSPEGDHLLAAGGGKTAQIWDWRRGRLACPTLAHEETIMSGCFVPGTPWVITGGHDGKIKFWDARTGMMIRPPLPQDGWVLELQLTADGQTLVACGFLGARIELINLRQALPEPDLDPADARLLAEIDADAEIFPGGGLAPLTPLAWLAKWREFRVRCPHYAGHRLEE